jgi:beta-glucanase (GH16 family)
MLKTHILSVLTFFGLLGSLLADPPEGHTWKVVTEFTDNFTDKTLNKEKWQFGVPNWRGREPALFVEENVQVKDGQLQLTAKAETHPKMDGDYKDFTTAAVSSVNRIRYGYFEIKAQTAPATISSSFWLSHNAGDLWTEIDIYEICGKSQKFGGQMFMDCHVFKAPGVAEHQHFPVPYELDFDTNKVFQVYGLEWDAQRIRWFLNGKVVRQKPNLHWRQALHLIVDMETFPDWFGLPDKADLPATYKIEYIRTWQR